MRRPDLELAARRWMAIDPDPVTRRELADLLAQGDSEGLRERFATRLGFGTAGIRGPLGAGPARMGLLVARQTAAAWSSHLLAQRESDRAPSVVVAHDARRLSDELARGAADVLTAAGVTVHWLGRQPTPVAAFAVEHLRTDGALVVTASHNPRGDNGLKIYARDGAQIIPPADADIAARIDPIAAGDPVPRASRSAPLHLHGDEVLRSYQDHVLASVRGSRTGPGVRGSRIALTALHGVGGDLLVELLTAAGHPDLHPVAEQHAPDGEFPTVSVPNPEEEGVTDLLARTAREVGAEVAVALDPDADRCAVLVPDPDGSWVRLTGDQVGAVLAWNGLRLSTGPDRLLVTSVVSSGLLALLAAAEGVHYAETLTGFKWLCRPALAHPEWRQVLAYEEALGYAPGPGLRDKDGLAAALAVADLVSDLAARKWTILDLLADLARRHGLHATRNFSVASPPGSPGPSPPGSPGRPLPAVPAGASLGGFTVERTDSPAPDVLRLWSTRGDRLVIRPSGTEPKVKVYCEVVEELGATEDPRSARHRAEPRLAGLARAAEVLIR